MTCGLVGKKIGMTRIFTDGGVSVPVSVIHVLPNKVTQIKSMQTDGYNAIQVTTGRKKITRLNKPLIGHFIKANVEPGDGLWEFLLTDAEADSRRISIGSELTVDAFSDVTYIDVVGISKGKGFAGVIKRHHFSSQDASHGNSLSERVHGSIGQNQSPGKVFKGKRMAGHLGNVRTTAQNLKIVKIDTGKNLLLVCGSVPGHANSYVLVYKSKKMHKEGGTL